MKLQLKIHLYVELLLATAIFLLLIILPSYVDDRLMNGTQSGKFFFFTYSLFAILILWAVSFLFNRDFRFRTSIIDLLVLMFVAWVSIDKYLFHDIHSLSLRYFELLGLLVLYFIIRTINSKYYIFLLLSICVGGAIQAVYGNLQLWGYYPSNHGIFKMTGSFFNPGPYAGYLCCVLPIALGVYYNYRKSHVDINRFEVLHLKCLIVRLFEKLKYKDSNLQNEMAQTRSLEREASNVSNYSKQLSFVAIKYLSLITIIAILLVLPAARSRAAWLGAIAGVIYLAWHKFDLRQLFKRRSQTSNGIPMYIGINFFKLIWIPLSTPLEIVAPISAIITSLRTIDTYYKRKWFWEKKVLIVK
jgi:O-antigen polymerase